MRAAQGAVKARVDRFLALPPVERLVAWVTRLLADYRTTRASLSAGGLAYFVALSIAPAALAFGTIAGVLFDPEQVRSGVERLAERAPPGLTAVQPVVEGILSTVENASTGAFTLTTLISTFIAIYAASKVVLGVRMAMNTVFGVVETRSGLIERGIATGVTLLLLVAGVALVILLTIVPRVLSWLGIDSPAFTDPNRPLYWALIVVLVYVIVRWIIRHAADREEPVSWIALGPWASTAGIIAATIGVDIYAGYSTSLGAAVLLFGTAVVILLWLYLCFVALLVGAIIEADSLRTRTTEAVQQPDP